MLRNYSYYSDFHNSYDNPVRALTATQIVDRVLHSEEITFTLAEHDAATQDGIVKAIGNHVLDLHSAVKSIVDELVMDMTPLINQRLKKYGVIGAVAYVDHMFETSKLNLLRLAKDRYEFIEFILEVFPGLEDRTSHFKVELDEMIKEKGAVLHFADRLNKIKL